VGFDSAATGAGGGASGLFICTTANAAARPSIAITPPAMRPPDPFFFSVLEPETEAAGFADAVIGTTFELAAAAAAAGFSSSKSPVDAGCAFSAAAFCSAVAAELIELRLTIPESSRPASEAEGEGLAEGIPDKGGGGVEPRLLERLGGAGTVDVREDEAPD
jgi:hypothetical protein